MQSPNTTPATRVFFDKKLKHASLEPLSVARLQHVTAGSVAKAIADIGELAAKEKEASDALHTTSSDKSDRDSGGGNGETKAKKSKAEDVVVEKQDSKPIEVNPSRTKHDESSLEDNSHKEAQKVSAPSADKSSSTEAQSSETSFPVEAVDKNRHGLYDESLDSLEICPLAYATVEEISNNVREFGGAALLIDYGENYPQGDTIRGFQKHKAAHILSQPGSVDISADVNFKACAQVGIEQGAKVQGPISQVHF